MTATRMWRWLPAVLAFVLPLVAAVAFQVALPADYKVNESPDYTAFYYPVAERVVDGNGLTVPDGRVADRFPPGYPVFLAGVITVADATGLGRASLITAASLVLHALGCLLLFAFARAFVRPWAACLGALTWGLSPVALWLTKQPNSELVFTVVVLGALVLVVPLLRPGSRAGVVRLTGVGALLGAAALIRPIAVGIVVPLAVVYLLVHRTAGVRRAVVGFAALCGAFVVVLAPWELHLSAETHSFIPLSTASGPSMREGLTFQDGPRQAGSFGIPGTLRDLMADADQHQDQLATAGGIASFLRQQASTRPAAVAELFALKAGRSWFATDSERYEAFLLAFQLPFVALAVGGMVRTWRHGPRIWVWLVGLLVVYFWAMTMLVLAIIRYMMLPEVLLAPFVVIGLQPLVVRVLRAIPPVRSASWFPRLARPPWAGRIKTEDSLVSRGADAPE